RAMLCIHGCLNAHMYSVTHSSAAFRPERRDYVIGRGGDAELRQDRVDEELGICLGIPGTAIGDDADSIARIGAGASRGFHHEIRPHAHQHQRLDALGRSTLARCVLLNGSAPCLLITMSPALGVSSSQMAAPGEP